MAEVLPLRALHYELGAVGELGDLVAPPYDVIDAAQRRELVARSPFNVVEVDLPQAAPEGADPYEHAGETLDAWVMQGMLVADREPAIWALAQEFTGPDSERRVRRGFLCLVRLAPYGPGAVRPHERTQPGPKEDRLRLTRATRHNLSPIFALHGGDAWRHIEPSLPQEPWAEVTDGDGTLHRVWRVPDPAVHEALAAELAERELLIADGHHRYETALAYEREVGAAPGEPGAHSYTLMCLVSLEDPGLAVFPTHRMLSGLTSRQQEALAGALREHFELEEVPLERLAPEEHSGPGDGSGLEEARDAGSAEGSAASERPVPGVFGYIDAHFRRGCRLRLRDPAAMDEALPDKPDAFRHLDAVILEELVLKRALGMSAEDIAAKRGIAYSSDTRAALAAVEAGKQDCAFLLRATPVEQVRAVAAAGETMPPKSTYFFPKLLTGIVFNPLS